MHNHPSNLKYSQWETLQSQETAVLLEFKYFQIIVISHFT